MLVSQPTFVLTTIVFNSVYNKDICYKRQYTFHKINGLTWRTISAFPNTAIWLYFNHIQRDEQNRKEKITNWIRTMYINNETQMKRFVIWNKHKNWILAFDSIKWILNYYTIEYFKWSARNDFFCSKCPFAERNTLCQTENWNCQQNWRGMCSFVYIVACLSHNHSRMTRAYNLLILMKLFPFGERKMEVQIKTSIRRIIFDERLKPTSKAIHFKCYAIDVKLKTKNWWC